MNIASAIAAAKALQEDMASEHPHYRLLAPPPEMPEPRIPPLSAQPGLDMFLRSPMPPMSGATSDNLRQFFRGGLVPQRRIIPPSPL